MSVSAYAVLDTLIGLTFLFLLFSLVASVIAEIISRFFSLRSKTLKEGIETLLNDPGSKSIAGLLVDHSLIKSLGRRKEWRQATPRRSGSGFFGFARLANLYRKIVSGLGLATERTQDGPSYIPPDRFAKALTQTILEQTEEETSTDGLRRNGTPEVRSPTGRGTMRNPEGNTPLEAAQTAHKRRDERLTDARQIVANLPDGELRRSLAALAERAGGDLSAFEASVATWFDESMDRVSGWYQRNNQRTLLILGFVLAVLFNLDALHIAKTLSQDKSVREAWANAAAEYVKTAEVSGKDAKSLSVEIAKLTEQQTPIIGWANLDRRFGDWYGKATASWDCEAGTSPRRQIASDEVVCIEDTTLNAGFTRSTARVETEVDQAGRRQGALELAGLLLGWLLSAIAIGQGAPFWFNALERLLKIRAAGIKPPKLSRKPNSDTTASGTTT